MKTCWQADIDARLDFEEILDAINDEYEALVTRQKGQNVADIRGKKTRLPEDFKISKKLDADTRIDNLTEDEEFQEMELTERNHDTDII
jgi:hypothetical protein